MAGALNGWERRFADPIILPDGGELITLGDAGHYVAGLPKAKHSAPEWRLAVAMLMQSAEDDALVMLAEIAMRRALNAVKPGTRAAPEARHYIRIRERTYCIARRASQLRQADAVLATPSWIRS